MNAAYETAVLVYVRTRLAELLDERQAASGTRQIGRRFGGLHTVARVQFTAEAKSNDMHNCTCAGGREHRYGEKS